MSIPRARWTLEIKLMSVVITKHIHHVRRFCVTLGNLTEVEINMFIDLQMMHLKTEISHDRAEIRFSICGEKSLSMRLVLRPDPRGGVLYRHFPGQGASRVSH
jgi:hypothetical protein